MKWWNRRSLGVVSTTILFCVFPLQAWSGVYHNNKSVSVVYSPDERECIFFTLDGVTQADASVMQNNEWFAVPKTHAGYKEIAAMLLMARATGTPLQHVLTTGGTACGLVEVRSLSI
jgi:hypothetical protein